MTFEFLLACRLSGEVDLRRTIADQLLKVLEDNLNDVDEQIVDRMVSLRLRRDGNEGVAENGDLTRHLIVGLTVELPDELESAEATIEEFAAALHETPPIYHVVKFEDPQLQQLLGRRASEIFALEMKLRRVLSLIYLYAYQNGDPYNLLIDEKTRPASKEQPKPEQMRSSTENQFFHLTFSQYINLNQRLDINLPVMLGMLHASSDFESFRAEITRTPVQHEDDAGLLAGLKERMDAVEAMRNCVAHNRRPSRRCSQNYSNALPLLDRLLDDYLERWQVPI
jgi:hypothetical protein